MATIFLLIALICLRNICKAECEGCSAGGRQADHDCYQLKAPKVFACRGTFTDSGGLNGAQAKAICGNGYEICPSAVRTAALGLTVTDCANIPAKNKFFASLESSSGSADCTTTGNNDIWGCADMEPLSSGQEVLVHCDSSTCRGDDFALCGNSLMAFLSKESLSPTDWSSGAWSFGSNTNEINTVRLNNAAYGGVLCCILPTDDPTKYPTIIPTNNPTYYPTIIPTFYPTINPTQNPTNEPTINPSVNPSINPSVAPTENPITGIPTNIPSKYPTAHPTKFPTFTPILDSEILTTIYNFSIIVKGDTITDVFINNIQTFVDNSLKNIFDAYNSTYVIVIVQVRNDLSVTILSKSEHKNLKQDIHDMIHSNDLSDKLDDNVDVYNKEKTTTYIVYIDLGNKSGNENKYSIKLWQVIIILIVLVVIVIGFLICCVMYIQRKRKQKHSEPQIIGNSDEINVNNNNEKQKGNEIVINGQSNNGIISLMKENYSEGNVQLGNIKKHIKTNKADIVEEESSSSNLSMYDENNTIATNTGYDDNITIGTVNIAIVEAQSVSTKTKTTIDTNITSGSV